MTGDASLRDLVVLLGRGGSERVLSGLLHQGEDH